MSKILIVGDTIGDIIARFLRQDGWPVTVMRKAAGVKAVYDALSETFYGAILITNDTMGVSHISTMIPIISNYFPRVRIMVLSGVYDDDLVRSWCLSGADCFMPMPFDGARLTESVKQLLE
jgi:DNA-binding response OmpR family regulator